MLRVFVLMLALTFSCRNSVPEFVKIFKEGVADSSTASICKMSNTRRRVDFYFIGISSVERSKGRKALHRCFFFNGKDQQFALKGNPGCIYLAGKAWVRDRELLVL
ncbi:hypothetical protein CLF_104397 [Clonorchis sinensis]|uniref:Secreted protein n=1 Tax=Clonorchis sinensis TaxID=79923 RepID=G7YBK8_CLOSI|nr:hypothetical protein CLF_104397 [Clonorchis sinensis]